ncbi:hypothetical protein N0B31_21595 (plasmid) [Salinirubellus salinus]|uniref:Uncharacterized protein n=1 Tax=Salinirubellus salinus TaxID=1364945 RepID=A0A9E7R863_9EURY|nr:hypothetical protein [Salinirubellus salinus]UWM56998.1 hypothetical protein N0B31_22390 [Salinirubellus salinus]UWM57038.1 hypothetical protein N0B31_21595 [Salinirubellus salinus]
MIALQPEAIDVASRWLILAGPLSLPSTAIDVASSVAPSLRAACSPLQPPGFGFGSGFRLGNNLNLIQTLTRAQVLYSDALLSTPDAQRASILPLQSGTDLSTLVADLKDAIRVPGWVGTLLKWSGLITMIVGIIAYFISPSLNNRRRGFMMATTGIVISIIGFAFPVFIRLLDHVLSG